MDVLGLGSVTIDDFFYLDAYPQADTKTPIAGHFRQIGGLTATALVTVARLGFTASYAGMLGADPLSEAVEAGLYARGVDCTGVVRRPDAGPIHALIIVGKTPPTRTILFEHSACCGADPALPDEAFIQSARVLLVDNWGVDGMIRAVRAARAAGIPIVGDFEFDDAPNFPTLLALTDHLIVSRRFAVTLFGDVRPDQLAQKLWTDDRELVAITCGTEGAWYRVRDDSRVYHQPAFIVDTVDSTGCGDVFHGAYAATLARGFDATARIRFAAAAAALKATRPGGQTGIPTWAAVETFLRDQP